MAEEESGWLARGLEWNDPGRIKTVEKLMDYIDECGFLPLFNNKIIGFSVEEHVAKDFWWTGNEAHDPWEWRVLIAQSRRIAYGKFFNGKSGFLSKEWFPYFANVRRDGYDFDSLYEDGKVRLRNKKVMDLFEQQPELYSYELKTAAGFGKEGEKNFNGVITQLQMQTYLLACDFQCRKNKRNEEYGMKVTKYCTPEAMWGYAFVTSAYKEEPADSAARIVKKMKQQYPDATEQQILSVCIQAK